eukprot:15457677-Alexandrium_andersonii.AAC.1
MPGEAGEGGVPRSLLELLRRSSGECGVVKTCWDLHARCRSKNCNKGGAGSTPAADLQSTV